VDLDALPGHGIRRLQQIAVALFLEEVGDTGVTPVQYAALQAVADQPAIDQRTLAQRVGFDTSTIAAVIDRLEARGALKREVPPEDRRARRLTLTGEGEALLARVVPGMLRAQQRMLDPLSASERAVFLAMLRRVVDANNESSRAPSRPAR
jgi:DNA-binding MarR family transcriptional regulator